MGKTILFLAANPSKTSHLRLDQELREIQNGIQRGNLKNELSLKTLWAPRPVDIRRAMLDYMPNILHFSGHGYGDEGIAFENEKGKKILVDSNTLRDFFRLFSDTLECVILNACYTQVQSDAIVSCIPYVIGISNQISDTLSQKFSVAFYDAIAAGKTYEFAFELASNAIRWEMTGAHPHPILRVKDKKAESNHEVAFYQETAANIQIVVGKDAPKPTSLSDEEQVILVNALASLLRVPTQRVAILRNEKGSIIFGLKMPLDYVDQLRLLVNRNGPDFLRLNISRIVIDINNQIEEWNEINGGYKQYRDHFIPRRMNQVYYGGNSLESIVNYFQNFVMVKLTGRIDSVNSHEVGNILKEITDSGRYKIVIDMTEVSFISSAGLRILIDTQKTCKKYNRGQVVLYGVSDKIRDILDLTGFTPLFRFCEDYPSIAEVFAKKIS